MSTALAEKMAALIDRGVPRNAGTSRQSLAVLARARQGPECRACSRRRAPAALTSTKVRGLARQLAQRVHQAQRALAAREVGQQLVPERVPRVEQQNVRVAMRAPDVAHRTGESRESARDARARILLVRTAAVAGLAATSAREMIRSTRSTNRYSASSSRT